MCIQPRGKDKLTVPDFTLAGNVVDSVNQHKYLGFILSYDYMDDDDINRQIRGLYTCGNMLIKCFKHCSDPVKSLLFKTYCSNMYCSQLWCNYSSAVFKKLKTSFNRVFRFLMSLEYKTSISQAMIDNNVNAFDINVRNYIYKFKLRVEQSNNLVINALINSFQFYTSCSFKHWNSKLYVHL